MSEEKYFQFPLFLMRDLTTNKEQALNNIIRYGLYSMSLKIQTTIEDAAKQLMYCYYRDRASLPKNLEGKMGLYINHKQLTLDEDYNGFNGETFNPELEIEQLLEIFKTDLEFQAKVIDFYKIRQAYKAIGVTGDYTNAVRVGKQIQNSIPKGEPMPMMNKNQLFEFRDNDKKEFDLMLFAINIGIRSIIGQKSYSKTNKKMILCRAFGYSSVKHLPDIMPELFHKYSGRYHFDRLLKMILIGNWNIISYAEKMRGMYVGFKSKITKEKLAEIAEMNKYKAKIEALKAENNAAREKALNKIKLQQTHQ